MRCLTILLALLTITGCAVNPPQPPIACAPAVEELDGNIMKLFEARPGHWNYSNIPEYSFVGQPGEVVTLIVRPANRNMFAAFMKRSSHNSLWALDDFATASYVVCPDGPRLQVTATLPPNDDGIYYFMITEHRGIPKFTADTMIALASGPLMSQDPSQMAPSALTTQLTSGPRSAPKIADAPEPIYGNTGKYMSPFTEDGTIAPWVEKSMAAAAGAGLGGAVGAYAGQKALEQVPFFGGLLGSMAGKAAGREIALSAAGGWDFIRANSDLSFNSLDDMARYLQAHHASHPQYAEVLKATYEIYPELQQSMAATRR